MKQISFYCPALALCAFLLPRASAQEPVETHTTIRSESRLVLVDSVVTDKKGNYIHDLTQKDFKVWEDNKEQSISTFSFEAGNTSPSNSRKHYLVLFFDNSTTSPADQIYARQAATKFVDANAGPNRLMAVVEFGGSVRVTQNFTEDADRLKKVLSGVKFSAVDPNAAGPMAGAFTNFSVRSVLGGLRNMAKGLADVPGRKTLVFLSRGFPMTEEVLSEITATIDACNRANVAIYPIDVGGLVTPIGMLQPGLPGLGPSLAMLHTSLLVNPFAFQGRGGGGGGGAGGARAPAAPSAPSTPSSGTSGSRGVANPPPSTSTGTFNGRTSTGVSPNGGLAPINTNNGAFNNRFPGVNTPQRAILPNMNLDVTKNQAVLFALANGTGGFVIVNTNNLLGGLEKIGKEQNEYYVLGYTPLKAAEPGTCHTLKVKVDRGGTEVRSRTGYCDAKTVDILAGTPTERELEARLTANATPTITASMLAPFFYISANTVRVNVAIEVPPAALKFVKDKGKLHSTMNVVGIAYLPDGGVAARFSDSVKLVFDDKKQVEAFNEKPFHYEKEFEMASGKYNLKVVFSSGSGDFGRLETPLTIEPWETSRFFMSALALSKDARPSNAMVAGIDAELLENRTPLVVSGVRVTPAGTTHFAKTDKGFTYGELYEPAMTAPDLKEAPALGLKVDILDGKTKDVKKDLGVVRLAAPPLTGNPAVPFGLRLPISELAPGSYRLQVTGLDAAGSQVTRIIPFQID